VAVEADAVFERYSREGMVMVVVFMIVHGSFS
jgi:hypothetical protein